MCREMTDLELQGTNGCGSSHWALFMFRIPEWLAPGFKRCCNRHDRRYQNAEDRAYADDELYDCWYYNAYHGPRWQRWYKLKIADIAYAAICKFGGIAISKYQKNESKELVEYGDSKYVRIQTKHLGTTSAGHREGI